MNPFSDAMDARTYDAARPYFHPLVFERLAGVCPGRFPVALDVACGTGQSTQALAAVSAVTVGIDASVAMLRHARRRDVIPYVRGQAECLPFPDSTFDLVTVGRRLRRPVSSGGV
jgi:ubiquinone/menaquinone biosynthesis C-methylase UbiE